ncbi:MAG: hypothetical protein ABMA25_19555, partial [Ilumatobacteraceae bacterium]
MRLQDLLVNSGDDCCGECAECEQLASNALLLGRVRMRCRPERDLMVSRVPFAPGGRAAGWFVTVSTDASHAIAEATLADMLEREKRQKEKFAALLEVSHAVVNSLDLNT